VTYPLRLAPLLLLLLLALMLPRLAVAQERFVLDNGLELVVIEDRRAPVVVHMIWYRVGAADETAGVSGIAHYLEHLMFKATERLEQGEFSAMVEAQGGRDNAFTSWDYTAYHQRVAADRLGLMMEMEAERMVNLRLDRSDWLPERDVILEERGQTLESSPDRQMQEAMRAALFQNHPYGRPIIGWRHEMEILDDAIAMDFYRRHYAPNNAVVIVAGDVAAAEALALAEAHYGPVPANPDLPPRIRPTEPPHLAERRVMFSDARAARPYVSRLYLAPNRQPGDQAQAAALQMLAAILGGSAQTSVLERRLTYDEGVSVTAWAGYMGTALDHGTFSLGIVPADGVSLEQAEAALDRVLAEFIEQGVDLDQFERVRRQLRAQEIFELDNAGARARSIGAALTTGLTLEDATGWLAALQAVTPDDVIAAARSLDRRAAVTAWMMRDD
jgi:zinc protease